MLFETPDTIIVGGKALVYYDAEGAYAGAWARDQRGFLLLQESRHMRGHSNLFIKYSNYLAEVRKLQDTCVVPATGFGYPAFVGNVSKLSYPIVRQGDWIKQTSVTPLPPYVRAVGELPVKSGYGKLCIDSTKMLKLRIWSEQKVCSFWTDFYPEFVAPTLKLFKMAGIDPSGYMFDNALDQQISYEEFIGNQVADDTDDTVPEEVKAEILKLKIQMHTANPEQRVVLQNKIDSLYKSAGVEVKKDMGFGSGKADKRATSAGYGSAAQYKAARTTSESRKTRFIGLFETPDTLVVTTATGGTEKHFYAVTPGAYSAIFSKDGKSYMINADSPLRGGHGRLIQSYRNFINVSGSNMKRDELDSNGDEHVSVEFVPGTGEISADDGYIGKSSYQVIGNRSGKVYFNGYWRADANDVATEYNRARVDGTLPPTTKLEGKFQINGIGYIDDSTIIRVRIWSEQKYFSFWGYIKPKYVKPALHLLQMIGENPEEYHFESAESGVLNYHAFVGDMQRSDVDVLPPEARKMVSALEVQMHVATPEQRKKLQAQIDGIYREAGLATPSRDMNFGSGKFDKRATSAGYGSAAQYRAARTTSENVERKYLNGFLTSI